MEQGELSGVQGHFTLSCGEGLQRGGHGFLGSRRGRSRERALAGVPLLLSAAPSGSGLQVVSGLRAHVSRD